MRPGPPEPAGRDPRQRRSSGTAWGLGTLLLAVALGWVLFQVRAVVVVLIGAVLLAVLLEPPVSRLARLRWFGRSFGRKNAALAVLLFALLLLVGIGYVVAPEVRAQGAELVGRLPEFVRDAQERLRELESVAAVLPEQAEQAFEQEIARLLAEAGRWAASWALSTALNLLQLVGLLVIPVGAFYLLADGSRLRREFLDGMPPRWRQGASQLLDDGARALSGYVRGQSAVCAAAAVMHAAFFGIVGLDFWLVLGLVAGIAEAVPFLGALVVSIAVAVVGLAEAPEIAVRALLYYLVGNQVVNFVLAPRLMSQNLDIHPFVIILAVLVGSALGGAGGALIALPAAVVLQTVTRRLWGRSEIVNPEGDEVDA